MKSWRRAGCRIAVLKWLGFAQLMKDPGEGDR